MLSLCFPTEDFGLPGQPMRVVTMDGYHVILHRNRGMLFEISSSSSLLSSSSFSITELLPYHRLSTVLA
jgi:hypothetical protein